MNVRIFWIREMECMCAQLDLGLYSHPKEFWGNGVRAHVSSKGKIPSSGKISPQRRIEPTTLRQAGQWAQHTTNELFRPPIVTLNNSTMYNVGKAAQVAAEMNSYEISLFGLFETRWTHSGQVRLFSDETTILDTGHEEEDAPPPPLSLSLSLPPRPHWRSHLMLTKETQRALISWEVVVEHSSWSIESRPGHIHWEPLLSLWEDTGERKLFNNWKEGLIIKLPKEGDLRDCGNYRGIILLSVPDKVLNRILLEGMKTTVESKFRDHQAGFRQDRSCTDHIATLRNIIE